MLHCNILGNHNYATQVFLSLLLLQSVDKTLSIEKLVNCPLKPPSSLPIPHPPLVIGHRGASFNLPEHTLASYRLALELGADYVEIDLVPTKDQHLVAVHTIDLNVTTDVAINYPDRYRTDVEHLGINKTGYFVQDFTLEEVKNLTVKQRVDGSRSHYFDWKFEIPTLTEIIDLMDDWNERVHPELQRMMNITKLVQKRPGLYVELKYPGWIYEDTGLKVEDIFNETLINHPKGPKLFFDPKPCSTLMADEYLVPPLVIESFEKDSLAYLHELFKSNDELYNRMIPPSVLLLHGKQCANEELWFEISKMKINGVGPDKSCILGVGEGEGRDFMNLAIKHGLVVHPWTERMEVSYVDEKFINSEMELTQLFCKFKVNGIFAENVALAVRVGAVGCETEKEVKDEIKVIETEEIIEEEEEVEVESGLLCGTKSSSGNSFGHATLFTILGAACGSLITYFYGVPLAKSRANRQSIASSKEDLYLSAEGSGEGQFT